MTMDKLLRGSGNNASGTRIQPTSAEDEKRQYLYENFPRAWVDNILDKRQSFEWAHRQLRGWQEQYPAQYHQDWEAQLAQQARNDFVTAPPAEVVGQSNQYQDHSSGGLKTPQSLHLGPESGATLQQEEHRSGKYERYQGSEEWGLSHPQQRQTFDVSATGMGEQRQGQKPHYQELEAAGEQNGYDLYPTIAETYVEPLAQPLSDGQSQGGAAESVRRSSKLGAAPGPSEQESSQGSLGTPAASTPPPTTAAQAASPVGSLMQNLATDALKTAVTTSSTQLVTALFGAVGHTAATGVAVTSPIGLAMLGFGFVNTIQNCYLAWLVHKVKKQQEGLSSNVQQGFEQNKLCHEELRRLLKEDIPDSILDLRTDIGRQFQNQNQRFGRAFVDLSILFERGIQHMEQRSLWRDQILSAQVEDVAERLGNLTLSLKGSLRRVETVIKGVHIELQSMREMMYVISEDVSRLHKRLDNYKALQLNVLVQAVERAGDRCFDKLAMRDKPTPKNVDDLRRCSQELKNHVAALLDSDVEVVGAAKASVRAPLLSYYVHAVGAEVEARYHVGEVSDCYALIEEAAQRLRIEARNICRVVEGTVYGLAVKAAPFLSQYSLLHTGLRQQLKKQKEGPRCPWIPVLTDDTGSSFVPVTLTEEVLWNDGLDSARALFAKARAPASKPMPTRIPLESASDLAWFEAWLASSVATGVRDTQAHTQAVHLRQLLASLGVPASLSKNVGEEDWATLRGLCSPETLAGAARLINAGFDWEFPVEPVLTGICKGCIAPRVTRPAGLLPVCSPGAAVTALAVQGDVIVVGRADSSLQVYELTERGDMWAMKHGELTCGKGGISALAVGGDWTFAASRDGPHDIKLWKFDKETGELHPQKDLAGHTGRITILQYSSSGLLFSASYDQSIKVWSNQPDWKGASKYGAHLKPIDALVGTDNLLFSAGKDHLIKLWTVDPVSGSIGSEPLLQKQLPFPAMCLCKGPGNSFVSLSRNSVMLWRHERGSLQGVKLEHPPATKIASTGKTVCTYSISGGTCHTSLLHAERPKAEASTPLPGADFEDIVNVMAVDVSEDIVYFGDAEGSVRAYFLIT